MNEPSFEVGANAGQKPSSRGGSTSSDKSGSRVHILSVHQTPAAITYMAETTTPNLPQPLTPGKRREGLCRQLGGNQEAENASREISTRLSKAPGSVTARSAMERRSTSTPAFANPPMKVL